MRDNIKINFAEEEGPLGEELIGSSVERPPEHTNHKPAKKSKLKRIIASLAIVIFVVFTIFASSIAFSNETLIKNMGNFGFIGQLGNLVTAGDRAVKGESEDRINVLLLGIGGGAHEGGTLTDTMILGAFQPSSKKVAMLSLPRDLYVKSTDWGWTKINAIHAYAEKRKAGSGGEATRQFLSELLGQDVPYYAVIDFDGFEKLIDEFGGIDVIVDNDLIDYSYPVRGREDAYPYESRYEKLVIKKGQQHFDGAMALKYARSRHALGNEGSDFARSKRQQKMLIALKDKILKYNFLANPGKISALLDAYDKNVKTNLQLWEILRLLKLGQDVDYTNPITYSLTDSGTPLIYDQNVNGAYVLLPYGGNYDKIKFVYQNIFTVGTSTIAINKTKWAEFKDVATTSATTSKTIIATTTNTNLPPVTEPVVTPADEPLSDNVNTFTNEKASIAILNGTFIAGWASQEASKLKAKGFTVASAGNSPTRGYTSIKIYNSSSGNDLTISELQAIYGVKASAPPAGFKSSADITIILGK